MAARGIFGGIQAVVFAAKSQVMTRFLVSLLLLLPILPRARAQQAQLDSSETLFTVMAAINLAGYDADLDSPANHPLREQIRRYLTSQDLPSAVRLKMFFEDHRQENSAAELSQYISFALLVNGPPAFEFTSLTYELPPDAQRLEGLGPVLAEFYRQADIHALYEKVQPAYEEMIIRYHEPAARTLFELNGYLRNPTSGVFGQKFQIYVSLLAAPNQIHYRSYGHDYYIVITPSPEPQIADIRYAYLHYVLDPLATRYAAKLEEKKALGDYALGAPYLGQQYKSDFLLLATSSLIKATEARLARVSAEEKQAMVQKAYRQGYILAPHFAEQLPAYEKQSRAMRFYFGDMVDAIDLAAEEARARDLEFDQERPVRVAKKVPVKTVEPAAGEKLLDQAEKLYRARDLDAARTTHLRILREIDDDPVKARAYYGLARIATLRNDPELSESLFKKALALSPPAEEKAWALVYLGRLSDIAGEAASATKYYRAALAVTGASPKALESAEKGLSGAFRRERESPER